MGSEGKFLRSALGPIGAALGAGVGDWPGVREQGFGPAVNAVADVLEDPDGVGFVVSPEQDVGASSVLVRVCSPDRTPQGGMPPFADPDGAFAVVVPMDGRRASFFVPWGAVHSPPPQVLVVVLYLRDGAVQGHTAFEMAPKTGQTLGVSAYLRPFGLLAMAVARADGQVERAELQNIRSQLQTLFELSASDRRHVEELLAEPVGSLGRLTASLSCRFPGFDKEELFFALIGVAASDGGVSDAEIEVLGQIARRLEVSEATWRKWAFRMGVDLPVIAEVEVTSSIRSGARDYGRRVVPSLILNLDRKGQDRRNPMATLSLLMGVATIALMFGSFLGGLTPYAAYIAVVLLPTQWLLGLVALGSGFWALRVARRLEGAGQGAAVTGMSLAAVFVLIQLVLLTAVCLGIGTTVVMEEMYLF